MYFCDIASGAYSMALLGAGVASNGSKLEACNKRSIGIVGSGFGECLGLRGSAPTPIAFFCFFFRRFQLGCAFSDISSDFEV